MKGHTEDCKGCMTVGTCMLDVARARIAYLEAWQAWAREAADWLCLPCSPEIATVLIGPSEYLCDDCAEWLAAHPMPKKPT